MNDPGRGTSSNRRRVHLSGKTSHLETLPRDIEISTHTVQDMSPIDSYGYGNPYDERTYKEEEHAQHPDAALEHNNGSQQTTSTDTSKTLLSNDTSNTTVPSTTHEIQQQSNAVLCTNSKQAISLLFDQRPKKSKQQIALEEQLDELYGESDDEDLLNEFKKRRDEGTLPIKRKCENTHKEDPSQQVSTRPCTRPSQSFSALENKKNTVSVPSSMISSISSSTSAISQQVNNYKQRSTKQQTSMKNRFIPPTDRIPPAAAGSELAKRWIPPPEESTKKQRQRAKFSQRFQPPEQLVQKGERAPRVTNGNDKGKTTPSPKACTTTPKAVNTTPKARTVATVSPPVPSDDSSSVVPNPSPICLELALTDESKKRMAYHVTGTDYYWVGHKPHGVTSLYYRIVVYGSVQNKLFCVELPNLPGATFYHLRLAIEDLMKGYMTSFKFRVLGCEIDGNQEETWKVHDEVFEKEISGAGGEKAADGSLSHPYTIYITFN